MTLAELFKHLLSAASYDKDADVWIIRLSGQAYDELFHRCRIKTETYDVNTPKWRFKRSD